MLLKQDLQCGCEMGIFAAMQFVGSGMLNMSRCVAQEAEEGKATQVCGCGFIPLYSSLFFIPPLSRRPQACPGCCHTNVQAFFWNHCAMCTCDPFAWWGVE